MAVKLPQTYFEQMAYGITLVLDDRLYKFENESSDDSKVILDIGKDSFQCVELEKLAKLEAMYYEDYQEDIDKWKKEALARINVYGKETKEFVEETKFLDFIVNKVFPYFVDIDSKSHLTSDKLKKADASIIQSIENIEYSGSDSLLKLLNKGKKKAEKIGAEQKKGAKEEGSVLWGVLGNASLVVDHLVYNLVDKKDYSECVPDTAITLKKPRSSKKYGIVLSESLADLKKRYHCFLEKMFEEEAIKSSPEVMKAKALRESLDNLLKSEIYSSAGISLIRKSFNEYVICLRVPEFANEGEDGFYAFPPTRVGVKVKRYDDNRYETSTTLAVDEYTHPFINNGAKFEAICLGNYRPNAKTYEEEIVKYLAVGRTTLMSGYFGDVGPHHRLNKSYFKKFEVSEEEAKKIGITNERKKRGRKSE